MIFFNLLEKDIFGGRVMVTKTLSNQTGTTNLVVQEEIPKIDSNVITSRFASKEQSPALSDALNTPVQSPKKNYNILHEPS